MYFDLIRIFTKTTTISNHSLIHSLQCDDKVTEETISTPWII